MTPIKLKHRRGLWIGLAILIVPFGGLGLFLLITGCLEKTLWAVLIGGFISLFIFYFTIRCITLTPSLTVDERSITFNHWQTFNWEDLEEISDTVSTPIWLHQSSSIFGTFIQILSILSGGNASYGYSGNSYPITTLRFKNGKKKFIYDDNYVNAWQVKTFLQRVVLNKEPAVTFSDPGIIGIDLRAEDFIYFKGYQLLSLRGALAWFSISVLIAIVIIAFTPVSGDIKVSCFFFAVPFAPIILNLFFSISSSLYYFGISPRHLLVKKHNIPWRKSMYLFTEIKEIYVETDNALYIVPLHWEQKLYPAPTLREKDWVALIKALGEKGIIVTDRRINMFS